MSCSNFNKWDDDAGWNAIIENIRKSGYQDHNTMYFLEDQQCESICQDYDWDVIIANIRRYGYRHHDYIKYKSNGNICVKLYCVFGDHLVSSLKNTIEIHKDIAHLNITPKLIECKQILKYKTGYFRNNGEKIYYNEDWYNNIDIVNSIYVLVTEKYGISLAEKYMNWKDGDVTLGPGPDLSLLRNRPELFEKQFPSKIIPNHIRTQIIPLVKKLEDHGWHYDDIHAGNFVVHNDIVKIIDFDCVTKRTSEI